MRRTVAVTVLALALALGALPAAAQPPARDLAPLHRAAGEAVEGSYIVVMKPGRAAEQAADRAGVRPARVYEHVLDGFAARLDERRLDAIRRNPNVAYVEEDQVVTVAAGGDVVASGTQFTPPWGLDRIDQRYRPLDGRYTYNTTASNVHAYVIDTGIRTGHWDFGGRARRGYDAFGGTSEDCHGHGTDLAGTVGGTSNGVAKRVTLWSVRVLSCSGGGSYSGVIGGIDWVRANHRKPAVALYGFGGGYSSALNSAVDSLSSSGVFVAVSSGDGNADACNFSPASAITPVTANASDRFDRRAPFSNYGPCTDGYAPGVGIPTISGGHMSTTGHSAAHVAGVGALYKAAFGDAASVTVKNWIIRNATPNVIQGNPPNTPNRLLYKAAL